MKDSIITLRGLFLNNEITHSKGVLPCLTYRIILEQIQGKEGIFNLRKSKYGDYIIFQFLLIEDIQESLTITLTEKL